MHRPQRARQRQAAAAHAAHRRARAACRRRCSSRSKSKTPNRSTIQPDGLRTPMNCRERMTRPPIRRVQSSPLPEVSNSTAMAASSVAAGSWNSQARKRPTAVSHPRPCSAPANATDPHRAAPVRRAIGGRRRVRARAGRATDEDRRRLRPSRRRCAGRPAATRLRFPPASACRGTAWRLVSDAPLRKLADQRRRRRHRDEGTVAALGDQAPDAAPCAGVQLQAQARRDPCRESADDRRCAPGAVRRAPGPHQPRRAPATTATTARHGGSTVPSRRRRRCRECRSVERTAPAPAGRKAATQRLPSPGSLMRRRLAPDMPAWLVGDRPARAAQDRRHQGRAARRIVAGHDAEGDTLDRSGSSAPPRRPRR